jgi:hypothetical protein
MNKQRNMLFFTLIYLFYVCFSSVTVSALPKISIQTHKDAVVGTLQPLTREEAKEMFGSDGELDHTPKDEFFITSDGRKQLTGGFAFLHSHFFAAKVSITNNSNNAITLALDNYLSINDYVLNKKSEIIERYNVLPWYMQAVFGALGIGAVISLPFLVMNLNENKFRGNYGSASAFTGALNLHQKYFGILGAGIAAIVAAGAPYALYMSHIMNNALKKLKSQFNCLDGQAVSAEQSMDHLVINPGQTITDVVFINREAYGTIDTDIYHSTITPIMKERTE